MAFDDLFTEDDKLSFDEKAFTKRMVNAPPSVELLRAYREELATAEPFEAEALETHLKSWLESRDAKIGQIIHALRVATTGKAVGFGMFETLAILGRERSLIRIDRALAQLEQS